MQDSVKARYGFIYDPRNNPPPPMDKNGKPLYPSYTAPLYGATKLTDEELIAEHGEWCRSRCVYQENKNAITAIMEEKE